MCLTGKLAVRGAFSRQQRRRSLVIQSPGASRWRARRQPLAVALLGALNSLSPDEDLQKFAKI
jgi:hypothetical protein